MDRPRTSFLGAPPPPKGGPSVSESFFPDFLMAEKNPFFVLVLAVLATDCIDGLGFIPLLICCCSCG
jgi:hypothetical protein